MNQDTRYPYTYAADYIRSLAGYDERGTKISRSDASKIRQGIAEILNLPDEELALQLADYYKEHMERIASAGAAEFLAARSRM